MSESQATPFTLILTRNLLLEAVKDAVTDRLVCGLDFEKAVVDGIFMGHQIEIEKAVKEEISDHLAELNWITEAVKEEISGIVSTHTINVDSYLEEHLCEEISGKIDNRIDVILDTDEFHENISDAVSGYLEENDENINDGVESYLEENLDNIVESYLQDEGAAALTEDLQDYLDMNLGDLVKEAVKEEIKSLCQDWLPELILKNADISVREAVKEEIKTLLKPVKGFIKAFL